MGEMPNYKHLEPRPGSNYRQWFTKGRKIRVRVLYDLTLGDEPMTPEEVAADYDLPLEMVLEAIDYCNRFPEVLQRDWEMEEAGMRELQARWPNNVINHGPANR
jgi:uncharacterized protein (DUF433 family)